MKKLIYSVYNQNEDIEEITKKLNIELNSLIVFDTNLIHRNWKNKTKTGFFYMAINPHFNNWCVSVSDFIRYENRNSRIPILLNNHFKIDTIDFNQYLLNENEIRDFDKRWIVHSTTLNNYNFII